MAIFVLTTPTVTITTENLSAYVRSVKLNCGADIKETTASGATAKTRLAGFADWDAEVEFNQDFDAALVDEVLFPLVGADPFVFKVRATSAVMSATNPSYDGTGVLETYPSISGNVGDVAAVIIRIRGSGPLIRTVP